MQPQKLYVVTRRDIAPGYQAVQAAHAALDFCFVHPDLAASWHEDNYLIFLSVDDELALLDLMTVCEAFGLAHTPFREPDIGDAVTAVAIAPGPDSQAILGDLPLALSELVML